MDALIAIFAALVGIAALALILCARRLDQQLAKIEFDY